MRRLYALAILVVVPAIALAGFVLVGWLAARPATGSFDWELASIFGTALGTLSLAVATGALAVSTARDVTATQAIARMTREEHQETRRPVVTGTVKKIETHGATPDDLTVELVNIGGGPAVRVVVTAEYVGGKLGSEERKVTVEEEQHPWLAAGTTVCLSISCTIELSTEYPTSPSDFRVRGSYRDRFGREVDRSIFDWAYDDSAEEASRAASEVLRLV